MTRRRLLRHLALGVAAVGACIAAAGLLALDRAGVRPGALAAYVEQRSSGHNRLIVGAGQLVGSSLRALERGPAAEAAGLPDLARLAIGAQPQAVGEAGPAAAIVHDVDALRAAMARAAPGAVITLAPGVYDIRGSSLGASRPGSAAAPVVVRAAQPGSVELFSTVQVTIKVDAPHWRFENLTIHGACRRAADCEHAFHVVGAASGFAALNNRIDGFNAHFKINGVRGRFPDHGLIEGNSLSNPGARATARPVTPIDLVAASGWTVRGNVISNFVKLGGNRVSYGAFAKGGGGDNVFERNLVWCEPGLKGRRGQQVGLSLGGGGTGQRVCRDGRCITEQDRGVIRANLIVGCSDAGIYLNRAADSRIEDNTLIDTGGIDVRYPASSALVDGNLVDGAIRSRDDGLLRLGDNRSTPVWQSYLGWHPVRNLFAAPTQGDFDWAGAPPGRSGAGVPRVDLCGVTRAPARAVGAFEDFGACRR